MEEREQIKKERQSLFNLRKKEQAKLKGLEQKMELVKIVRVLIPHKTEIFVLH